MWNNQQALLLKDEETPTASVLVYTIIGQFLATGERLFEKIYVRTLSFDSDGSRVYLGYFDTKGLVFSYCRDDFCGDNLGLSAVRKW